jgi:hypothetical protein
MLKFMLKHQARSTFPLTKQQKFVTDTGSGSKLKTKQIMKGATLRDQATQRYLVLLPFVHCDL